MASINASTVVGYSTELPSPRVIVDFEPAISYNPQIIKIRVYPNNPDELVASGGTIRVAGNSALSVEKEIVSFELTDTAQPQYPITSAFSWRAISSLSDGEGNSISPDFIADPDTGNIRCSQSVLGSIEVKYQAGYTIADYIPGAEFKTQDLDAIWVAARKGKTIGKLQIASNTFGTALDYVELYSVTSVVVIDKNGRWELPQDWPDAPTYDPVNVQPPDPEESATELRTHDRGVIDNKGRVQFDRPFIRYEQPYVGTANYNPVWTYTQGTPPAGYEEAFQDFDFAELKSDLAARYPGIQGL